MKYEHNLMQRLSHFRFAPGILALGTSLFLTATSLLAQQSVGKWDGVEGKRIANLQEETLGFVSDVALDIENGRYVGVVVPIGGFLGFGVKNIVIPPAVLGTGTGRNTLYLNMDKERFRNAPTFRISRKVGPPQSDRVAEVYRYFGQQPYFTLGTPPAPTANAIPGQEYLGFIQRGSRIIFMTVENLQGKAVGNVFGFRDLDRSTGRIGGVVISPLGYGFAEKKIVVPQALRYNLKHTRLRINNHDQAFKDSPDLILTGANRVLEDPPQRPGTFPAPLVQGASQRDKAITLDIRNAIAANSSLSHYGQNVEIGTVKGKVTLRGRLETAADKNEIVAIATKVAGRGNVTTIFRIQPMSQAEEKIDEVLKRE